MKDTWGFKERKSWSTVAVWAALWGCLAAGCGEKSNPTIPTPTPPKPVDKGDTTVFQNPLLPSGPDPWVYQDGDTYYMMHTTYTDLRIYKTNRMSRLGKVNAKVVWTPTPGGNNSANIWAPELYKLDGKWYIYYTAGHDAGFGLQRLWVLENPATDPTTGTWTLKGRIASPDGDFWAIDGSILEQNGKRYLTWSGHNGTDNVQRLYISEMSSPWTLTGPKVELSSPQHAWERNGDPLVNEGPEILKHDGKTFLVYSASFCGTDFYALGLLTAADTADPMRVESWTKSDQPVFTGSAAARTYAPGHNGFFVSKDGTENWIIYHANSNPNEGCLDRRNPRMQKFGWKADGSPDFGTPQSIGTDIPVPSGE